MPGETRAARSFVAAGSGEAREGGLSYEGRIIRRGEKSPDAMRVRTPTSIMGVRGTEFVVRVEGGS